SGPDLCHQQKLLPGRNCGLPSILRISKAPGHKETASILVLLMSH
ncbi:hypothetical protein LEMLEM_LOCUS7499, partial [Lemmus lemmus]